MARLNTLTFGVAFAMFLVLMLSGCGGKRSAVSPQAPGADIQPQLGTTESSSGVRLVEVERALEELDALAVPDGVDIQLFNELKQALKEQLEARTTGKIVCGPPTGSHNQVTDLTYTANPNGTFNLSWHYRNQGDYDQNGAVAISDITPIAMNFGRKVADYPQLEPVDGSGNGIVGIEDITSIAANFGFQVAHYAVDRAPSPEGEWAQIWLVEMGSGAGPGRLEFGLTVAAIPGHYCFRVVPCDSQQARGCESVVTTVAGDPPEIVGVDPESGVTGEGVVISAVANGSEPFTYTWDFGGWATPNESSLDDPLIVLGAPGDYSASLTVTNLYGEDVYEFTLTVLSDVTYDEVEDNDSTGEANNLPALDFTGFTGNLGPGGYDGDNNDYFRLTVTGETLVRVRMTLDSGTGDLGLQVLGTDGTTVLGSSNTAGDEESIICELPSAGTYYVRCQAHSGYSDYTLAAAELDYDEREDNDGLSEANALPDLPFSGFAGNLGAGGYDGDNDDYFQFVVDEAGTIELTMTQYSTTANLDLVLFDTDGTTVLDESHTADFTEYISYDLPGAGTYFVKCEAQTGVSDYVLEGTFEPPKPPYVLFVTPQVVEQGVATELSAIIDGTADTYDWTFGAGAFPPSSTDAQPIVTFGTVGECDCNLTISGPLGTDVCDFVVLVPSPAMTNAVLLMPSRIGVQAGDIVGVTVYAWDTGYGMASLDSCSFTYSTELVPVADSGNLGEPGGSSNYKDGIWASLSCNVIWLPVLSPTVIAGVTAMDFIGLSAGSSGALFNVQFTAGSAGTATLEFVHDETHYQSPDFVSHFFDQEVGADIPIS
jgi:hypothetical protein